MTRQIERATAYAARKGWTVDPAHVYEDDGISGAEFVNSAGRSKRRGFLALMTALKPTPPFQVLITMEQSRVGRSLDEVPFAIKRITDAGVRIFQYLTDREVKRESASDKFMVHAVAFVDDMHREQARERTRDALRRKAERGHVAGGTVYGYRNVRHAGFVERVIDPTEAGIIRRIFAEISAGCGYARVAQRLNADGIAGPRTTWAMTCVREMVWRDLYRGRLVYGKTRWVDRDGTKVKVRVPADDWITVDAPALRIIDEPTWQAAHARLARTRQTYNGSRPRPPRAPGLIPASNPAICSAGWSAAASARGPCTR